MDSTQEKAPEELLGDYLAGIMQEVERGNVGVIEKGGTKGRPGNLGLATINRGATNYMRGEIEAILRKARGRRDSVAFRLGAALTALKLCADQLESVVRAGGGEAFAGALAGAAEVLAGGPSPTFDGYKEVIDQMEAALRRLRARGGPTEKERGEAVDLVTSALEKMKAGSKK